MSRKHEAIKRQLTLEENSHLARVIQSRGIPLDQISETILPDNFKFDGSKVINGTFCNTAGEYKEALDKNNTDMSGWTGTGS